MWHHLSQSSLLLLGECRRNTRGCQNLVRFSMAGVWDVGEFDLLHLQLIWPRGSFLLLRVEIISCCMSECFQVPFSMLFLISRKTHFSFSPLPPSWSLNRLNMSLDYSLVHKLNKYLINKYTFVTLRQKKVPEMGYKCHEIWLLNYIKNVRVYCQQNDSAAPNIVPKINKKE